MPVSGMADLCFLAVKCHANVTYILPKKKSLETKIKVLTLQLQTINLDFYMKKIITYAIIIAFATLAGCSKEKDESYVSPVQQTQTGEVLYSRMIQPLLRKSCSASHCHNVHTRPGQTKDTFLPMIADGRFYQRVFVLGESTPCGNLDGASLAMLRTWMEQGSRMDN